MTETGEVSRPAPLLSDDNHFFWDAAREGRLVTQRCEDCGQLRHPPRPMCPTCHSLEFEIIDLTGEGVVYSYAILHHPQNPAFEYPVLAALDRSRRGCPGVVELGRSRPIRDHDRHAGGRRFSLDAPRWRGPSFQAQGEGR